MSLFSYFSIHILLHQYFLFYSLLASSYNFTSYNRPFPLVSPSISLSFSLTSFLILNLYLAPSLTCSFQRFSSKVTSVLLFRRVFFLFSLPIPLKLLWSLRVINKHRPLHFCNIHHRQTSNEPRTRMKCQKGITGREKMKHSIVQSRNSVFARERRQFMYTLNDALFL